MIPPALGPGGDDFGRSPGPRAGVDSTPDLFGPNPDSSQQPLLQSVHREALPLENS